MTSGASQEATLTPIRTMLAAIAVGTSLLFPVSLEPSHPLKPGSTEVGFGTHARGGVDPGYGTYAWPVVGPVIRGFEPPPNPYGPGHRGIDIGAPLRHPDRGRPGRDRGVRRLGGRKP